MPAISFILSPTCDPRSADLFAISLAARDAVSVACSAISRAGSTTPSIADCRGDGRFRPRRIVITPPLESSEHGLPAGSPIVGSRAERATEGTQHSEHQADDEDD